MAELPEGGYGWFVVLGRFIDTFLQQGIHKSLGVLLAPLQLQLNADVNELGWCAGLYGGLANLLGPISIVLLGFTSPRRQIIAGSLLASISFLFTALFVENYVHLLVTFTLAGIGHGITSLPVIPPTTWYFKKRFAIANGIALVGGSFGFMFLPILTQYFLTSYGLRGTLLLLSGLSFHGCIAGALMRKPKHFRETTKHSRLEESNPLLSKPGVLKKLVTFFNQIIGQFRTTLFVDVPKFAVYQATFALYAIGYSAWIIYLVPHAINKGILPSKAVFLSTIGGLGTIVGRVGYGPLVDYRIISGTALFAMMSFLCAITFLVDPLVDTLLVMSCLAFVAGITIGSRYPLSITMTKDIVEPEHFVSAMGWTSFFTGIGKAIGPPLTGWLANSTGDYRIAFLLIGTIDMVIALVLVLIDLLQGFICK